MKSKKGETPRALLRRLRDELGYTQEKMAKSLGLLGRTYQRYESGEVKKVPGDVVLKAQQLASRS